MESSDSIDALLAPQQVTPPLENDYDDDLTEGSAGFKEILMVVGLLAFVCADKVHTILATHPVAIGTRNLVSVAVGEGGTIGFMHPMQAADKFIQKASST